MKPGERQPERVDALTPLWAALDLGETRLQSAAQACSPCVIERFSQACGFRKGETVRGAFSLIPG